MKRDFNSNVDPYYKYILCYIDELLHLDFNPKYDTDTLNLIYRLKEGFWPQYQYLGANVEKEKL